MWKCLPNKTIIENRQKLDIWKETLNITNFYFDNGCIGKILVAYQKKIKQKVNPTPLEISNPPFW